MLEPRECEAASWRVLLEGLGVDAITRGERMLLGSSESWGTPLIDEGGARVLGIDACLARPPGTARSGVGVGVEAGGRCRLWRCASIEVDPKRW